MFCTPDWFISQGRSGPPLSFLSVSIKILNFFSSLSLRSLFFFLLPSTIQDYWQQLAKMSSRKDNRCDAALLSVKLFSVSFPEVMLKISTISKLAYACGCVIPFNMLYADNKVQQGQTQNGKQDLSKWSNWAVISSPRLPAGREKAFWKWTRQDVFFGRPVSRPFQTKWVILSASAPCLWSISVKPVGWSCVI